MQKPPNPKKSRYFDNIVLQVACGHSIKDAAQASGCSLNIAYGLSRTSEFRQEVSEIRREALQQAVGMLTNAAAKAAACLVKLMEDDDPKIRLAASSKLMDRIVPMTELHDLRQEIQELRAAMAPQLKVAR